MSAEKSNYMPEALQKCNQNDVYLFALCYISSNGSTVDMDFVKEQLNAASVNSVRERLRVAKKKLPADMGTGNGKTQSKGATTNGNAPAGGVIKSSVTKVKPSTPRKAKASAVKKETEADEDDDMGYV